MSHRDPPPPPACFNRKSVANSSHQTIGNFHLFSTVPSIWKCGAIDGVGVGGGGKSAGGEDGDNQLTTKFRMIWRMRRAIVMCCPLLSLRTGHRRDGQMRISPSDDSDYSVSFGLRCFSFSSTSSFILCFREIF